MDHINPKSRSSPVNMAQFYINLIQCSFQCICITYGNTFFKPNKNDHLAILSKESIYIYESILTISIVFNRKQMIYIDVYNSQYF